MTNPELVIATTLLLIVGIHSFKFPSTTVSFSFQKGYRGPLLGLMLVVSSPFKIAWVLSEIFWN